MIRNSTVLPRITIITPSLNQAPFLERTIRSVVEQDYENLEYLVFDGGSSDGSVEILERYGNLISYWESIPDRGQSHAINKGLARATGEIVAYVNSDDYYLPEAFATVAQAFTESPDAEWVCGACRYLKADGTLWSVLRPRAPKGPRPMWLRDYWYAPQASSFWRRSAFERLGGFREDLDYAMDFEFGLRLALAGVLPVAIERELAVRAHHEAAKSAVRENWVGEHARIDRDLRRQLSRWELIVAFLYRVARKVWRYGISSRARRETASA